MRISVLALLLAFPAVAGALPTALERPIKASARYVYKPHERAHAPIRRCPEDDLLLRLTGRTKVNELEDGMYEMECDHGHSWWISFASIR